MWDKQKYYIPFDIFPRRCNIKQFIYFRKIALHVSCCVCSWWWVEIPPKTCRAVFQK